MTNLPEMRPLPCFMTYVPYEHDGAVYELDIELYTGIQGIVEQYVAHLGHIEVKGDTYSLPHAKDVTYPTKEEAAMALFEWWKQPKKGKRVRGQTTKTERST